MGIWGEALNGIRRKMEFRDDAWSGGQRDEVPEADDIFLF